MRNNLVAAWPKRTWSYIPTGKLTHSSLKVSKLTKQTKDYRLSFFFYITILVMADQSGFFAFTCSLTLCRVIGRSENQNIMVSSIHILMCHSSSNENSIHLMFLHTLYRWRGQILSGNLTYICSSFMSQSLETYLLELILYVDNGFWSNAQYVNS